MKIVFDMGIRRKCHPHFFLIGLFICLVFSFVQCNTKSKSQSDAETKELTEAEALMNQWAEKINESCPMKVDDITRLDSARVHPDKVFQYYYTITNRAEFDLDQWKTVGEKHVRNMYKSDPSMADFRIHVITVKYQYSDKGGNPFYSFTINPSDYQ